MTESGNIPVVAIVGRPNVGKSQLFNRLAGSDSAIVSEEAGTTRDRHFARAEWGGRAFWLVDTGGLTGDPSIPMDVEIQKQVMQAIAEADLMLLVVDAKMGCTRRINAWWSCCANARKPWLLVANKVDDPRSTDFYEFYNLGAGDPIPVSAINGKNSGDLLDEVVSRFPESVIEDDESLRIAVIGRPNVGKSSLVNRLLGEDRLVVAAEAGTTRDAIDTPMQYHGQTLTFVDTAGLRRQSKIDDGIEFYSALRTRRAIERAQVCVLMLDAAVGTGEPGSQDRDAGVGEWLRADHRRQQVGHQGREDRQVGGKVPEGGRRKGALSEVRALPVHVGAHRPARDEGARDRPPGGRGAKEAHLHRAGELRRSASSPPGCSRRRRPGAR